MPVGAGAEVEGVVAVEVDVFAGERRDVLDLGKLGDDLKQPAVPCPGSTVATAGAASPGRCEGQRYLALHSKTGAAAAGTGDPDGRHTACMNCTVARTEEASLAPRARNSAVRTGTWDGSRNSPTSAASTTRGSPSPT